MPEFATFDPARAPRGTCVAPARRLVPRVESTRATLFLAALLLCTGGCYEARWSAAGKQPTPASGIEGRWAGTWHSDANGHAGGLRCIISDVTPQSFKADFKASYAWVFTFTYETTMRIKAADAASRPGYAYFAGDADLGWLAGGQYTYDGKVGPTEFFCNYRSKGDHGTFQMTRPGGEVRRE